MAGVFLTMLRPAVAEPFISEFMAINSFTLKDETTNFPDWIEICNPGSSNINMAGWQLKDSSSTWIFPSTNIAPGGYLVVFADNKNLAVPGKPLHTNFKLNSDGEYLGLYKPNGITVVSELSPAYPMQYADVSYGWSTNLNAWAYFSQPTPRAANIGGRADVGAVITQVGHLPGQPMATNSLTVTAHVVAGAGGAPTNVVLNYVVMFNSTNQLAMVDDGAHGDGVAGDGIYGAVIPASTASPGQMIRYAVRAWDAAGNQSRMPVPEDPADYYGTMVFNPSLSTNPPSLSWFLAEGQTWESETAPTSCTTFDAWKDTSTNYGDCYLYYLGQFYAGVTVRKRGQTTFDQPDCKLKFDLPDRHLFIYDPAREPVSEFNVTRFPWESSKMRDVMCSDAMTKMNVPASSAFYLKLSRNNATAILAAFIEQQDDVFLRRQNLDTDGAFYKSVACQTGSGLVECSDLSSSNVNVNLKSRYRKVTRDYEDNSDLDALRQGLSLPAKSDALRLYMFDSLNIPEIINYMTVAVVLGHNDRCEKNFYVYRDSNGNGEWSMFPWDMDETMFTGTSQRGSVEITGAAWKSDYRTIFYGDCGDTNAHVSHSWLYWDTSGNAYTNSYNRMYDAIIRMPATREMYLRRLRTTMDQLLGSSSPGYIENRCNFYGSLGGDKSTLLTYCSTRRSQLYSSSGEFTNIPPAVAGSPKIRIGVIDHTPASGNQAEEYIELVNTNSFAMDISGWQLTNAVTHVFRQGTVIPAGGHLYVSPDAQAFRHRTVSPKGGEGLFVQDAYRGRLAPLGETVTLLDNAGSMSDSKTYTATATVYPGRLRVTELMYHPDDGDSEYIEFKNTGDTPLDLNGIRITDGVTFDFTGSAVTSLAPGAFALVVRNLVAFTNRYGGGLPVAGEYSGNLSDNGEALFVWSVPEQACVFDCTFRNNRNWPRAADGAGHSLVPLRLADQGSGVMSDAGQWRASTFIGGSPGADDPQPLEPGMVLNEIAAMTVNTNVLFPDYESNDWMELFNRGTNVQVFTGWYLSDDASDLHKWPLPFGSLAAGQRIVFDEITGFHTPLPFGFGLSSLGETVYLSYLPGGGVNRVADCVHFGPQEENITMGRYPDGADCWTRMMPTRMAANDEPVYEARFTEIMYHPPTNALSGDDNVQDEFVEILNEESAPLPLWTALGPWRVSGSISYVFPTNTILAMGERVLLVSFAPTNTAASGVFCSTYGLEPGVVRLFGPYDGRLSNEGDRLALERMEWAGPVTNQTNAWVEVDTVDYFDSGDWPTNADGTGKSLQWREDSVCNGAASWLAGLATPGASLSMVWLVPSVPAITVMKNVPATFRVGLDNEQVTEPLTGVQFMLGTQQLGTVDTELPFECTASLDETKQGMKLYARLTDGAGAHETARQTVYILDVANTGRIEIVTEKDVRFTGRLEGAGEADVSLFWDTTDRGAQPVGWAGQVDAGVQPAGDFTVRIQDGLQLNTGYVWRVRARTLFGEQWSALNTFDTHVSNYWRHRLKIQFAGYEGGDALTGFPALVVLSTNLPGLSYSDFSSANGMDLRFADSTETTILPFELEQWNRSGKSYAWVRVPRLGQTNFIWAYWGNPAVTVFPASITNGSVWDAGEEAVWHGGSLPLADVTSNRTAATCVGIWATNGVVAGGLGFDGTNDSITPQIAVADYAANRSNLTVSVWVNPQLKPSATVFGAFGIGSRALPFFIRQSSNGVWQFSASSVLGSTLEEHAVDAGQWQLLTLVLKNQQFFGYKNGLPGVSTGAFSSLAITNQPQFGYLGGQTGSFYYAGRMDEMRIAYTARSTDWIRAMYLNVMSNDSFQSYTTGAAPATVTLTVYSTHGMAQPVAGVYTQLQGAVMSCALTNPIVAGNAYTQYVAAGWAGSGDMPATGQIFNTGDVTLQQDSAITWLWRTNVWLAVANDGYGHVDSGNAWQAVGGTSTLTAISSNYYQFSTWTGDVESDRTNHNPVALTMSGARQVGVEFVPVLTSNQTPLAWLARYYATTSNWEIVADTDTDGDGQNGNAEFIAGTDPGNSNDCFVLAGGVSNNLPWISFMTRPVTGAGYRGETRLYSVAACSNLASVGWHGISGWTNLPATGLPVVFVATNGVQGMWQGRVNLEKGSVP